MADFRVRVGTAATPRVSTVSYGNRTLKGASDLVQTGSKDWYVIVYREGNFFVQSVSSATTNIDNGFF